MSKKAAARPARLEIGLDVVRIPQTIHDGEDGGKGPHTPMRGYVCYIHPKGRFHTVAFKIGGKIIKESFRGVEV